MLCIQQVFNSYASEVIANRSYSIVMNVTKISH
jgi:hypothetical protein